MKKRNDVLSLLRAGLSDREIERKLDIRRETVAKYAQMSGLRPSNPTTAPAVATSIAIENRPGWPPDGCVSKEVLAAMPVHVRSACESHRGWIAEQVQLGRNAMSIYQDLVERFAFTHKYNSVKRFVRGLKRRDPEQFDRLEFDPGEESQVDFGQGAPTRHPKTGKMRRPWLFVMTLRYSRRAFRKVVWTADHRTWCELHEQAWRYFGGCTLYVVLDNLKQGVLHRSDVHAASVSVKTVPALQKKAEPSILCMHVFKKSKCVPLSERFSGD